MTRRGEKGRRGWTAVLPIGVLAVLTCAGCATTRIPAGKAPGEVGAKLPEQEVTVQEPETSDADGLVQFTNLIQGAAYKFRRGSTAKWKRITIPSATTADLTSILGSD